MSDAGPRPEEFSGSTPMPSSIEIAGTVNAGLPESEGEAYLRAGLEALAAAWAGVVAALVVRVTDHVLLDRVAQGARPARWWYGLAWREDAKRESVWMPLPLNLLAAWGGWLLQTLKWRLTPQHERAAIIATARLDGMGEGYVRGLRHGRLMVDRGADRLLSLLTQAAVDDGLADFDHAQTMRYVREALEVTRAIWMQRAAERGRGLAS